MIKIIGISGYSQSGKDLSAQILQQILQEHIDTHMGFQTWDIKRFSYKLKQIVGILTGVEPEKFEDQDYKSEYNDTFGMTNRELLRKVGTECIRDHLHKDTWAKALFTDKSEFSKWIIPDLRFLNEAKEIVDRGGVTIRINRGESTSTHPSERELDKYYFDYTIDNTGDYDNLRKQLILVAKDLKTK